VGLSAPTVRFHCMLLLLLLLLNKSQNDSSSVSHVIWLLTRYFKLSSILLFYLLPVGHTVLSINGEVADGRLLKNDSCVRDILDVINDSENYPIAIKFGRAKLSSNEKIMLAGMFHS